MFRCSLSGAGLSEFSTILEDFSHDENQIRSAGGIRRSEVG
jgi:hypothetical protein